MDAQSSRSSGRGTGVSDADAGEPDPNGFDPKEFDRGAGDAFRTGSRQINELKEYAGHFISAKIDGLKLSVRNVVLYAVIGVLGGLAGAALLATAIVLLFTGIAHGLGELLGGRPWLGDLIVGGVVLGLFGVLAIVFLGKFVKASRQRTVSKYESRRRHQQDAFGHDVAERAASAGRVAN